MKDVRKKLIKKARRVVIKVGSAVIAGPEGKGVFERLAGEVIGLKKNGVETVVVTSGAVASGIKKLKLANRPSSIPEKQAVAAVGQVELMAMYNAAFSSFDETTAQVLLTHDDIGNRKRFLNARNTLLTLLGYGITPIINENDTVAVDEIKFGDNDALSALVASLVEADLLVILTDIDGLFDSDPRKNANAKRVKIVEDVDALQLDGLSNEAGALGTGGIRSKCLAARMAAHFGVPTIVANGTLADGVDQGILAKIFASEDVGTLFLPREDRLTSKKHWIAFSARPTGRLFVDDGAREALVSKGKSLLPSGIKDVDGSFDAGEVVHCVDAKGMEFARGVSNYSSQEIGAIKGLKSSDIEGALGYRVYDEVIHRDNLVVI